MRPPRAPSWAAMALLLALPVLGVPSGSANAQSSRETERKLERVNRELKSVAAERRKLEGQRGEASRELRSAAAWPAGSA